MRDALQAAFADLPAMEPFFAAFERHWALVRRWNTRINLTAIHNNDDAARLHYRDCAEVLAFLDAGDVLDLGSGAGFPGVVLAIASERSVTLMEPRRKRVSFLRAVKAELGLDRVSIVEGKSTDRVTHRFANVVTRATFSAIGDLEACRKWGGRLVAMRTAGSDGSPQSHHYRLAHHERELAIWPDTVG